MNVYRIELEQGDLSPKQHYVLAENFKDAVVQAEKLLIQFLKEWEDSEIREIALEFELEVVK